MNRKIQVREAPQASTSKPEAKTETPIVSFMKRDRSLIFTTLPEEESPKTETVEEKPKEIKEKPVLKRPKNLNLRLKLNLKTNLEENEGKTLPEVASPSRLPTNVCSTPLGSKILHENILSICSLDVESEENQELNVKQQKPKLEEEPLESKVKGLKTEDSLKCAKVLSKSWTDLRSICWENDAENEESVMEKGKTITDPTFPVFHPNGKLQISSVLHRNLLGTHMQLLNAEMQKELKEKIESWKKQFVNEKRKKQKREKLIATLVGNQECKKFNTKCF